jgi:hypothetical protein
MESRFIRVSQGADKTWAVLRGPRSISLLRFAIKSHAVAYARAVSLAGKLTLFVDDGYGTAIRQSTSTMTSPKIFN